MTVESIITIYERMKETIQNLIFLVILGVAGYFAYQYFFVSSHQDSAPATFNMDSLPEECQRAGELLKNAFDRNEKGEIKKVQVNGYIRPFRECLRRGGIAGDEIDKTVDQIKNSR